MRSNSSNSNNNRKVLSILSYGSILFSGSVVSIFIPIGILLASEDTVVRRNAKEALNVYITAFILIILLFLIMNIPNIMSNFMAKIFMLHFIIAVTTLLLTATVFILLGVMFIMPIIMIVKVFKNPDRSYRYPLILHLL